VSGSRSCGHSQIGGKYLNGFSKTTFTFYLGFLLLLVELFCFSLQYLGKEQFTFLGDLTAKNSSDFEAFDSNLGWREIDARASSEQDVDVVVLGGSFTY
jgi:hypothetical protein